MYSFEPGVYTAKNQPDIIVTYGGEIAGDDQHSGPWVQWRFPWQENEVNTNIVFQFGEMVAAAGYKLTEPRPSLGFQSK